MVSNNHVLVSYLSGIYLESWFSWLVGKLQKALKKRRKQAKEKHEQKEKRRMQGKSKSSNSNKYHYLSYKKLYFARK